MTLRLTPASRALLKRAKSLSITVACTFTPPKGAASSTTGKFQLHR
jgi:hypothetical protein